MRWGKAGHNIEHMFASREPESQDLAVRDDLPEPVRKKRARDHDRRIGELGSHVNAAMAEVLLELGEFIALDGWHDDGAKTPEDWVVWRLGVTPSDARSHVRIARRLNELPTIAASFRKGELSYWQVRAMMPVATPEIEGELLNIARYSTAGQLQRIVRAYKGCLDRAELEHAQERHRHRSLNYFFDNDGFLVVRGRLSPEDGAILAEALNEAERSLRAEMPKTGASGEVPTAEQISADALVEVARGGLAALRGETDAARIPEVTVHVDVRSLIDGTGDRCEIADGPVLASETARRLTCDAEVQALFESDGKVLDFGRRRRTAPPRLRRALEQRDLTCRFPGCNRKRFREAHHIVHWTRTATTRGKGKTKPANMMLLCSHHHQLVHEGGYSVVIEADRSFTFLRSDGTPVPQSPATGGGSPKELVERHRRQQLRITPDTGTTLWDGYAPNLAACVDALLAQGGMLAIPRRGSP